MDKFSLDEILSGDRFMQELADKELGPVLESLGIQEDALSFFKGILKVAAIIQLFLCGMVFYGSELYLHYDAGESFRAVLGLMLGFGAGMFTNTDKLFGPLYNAVVRFVNEDAAYEVPSPSDKELLTAFNRIGLITGVAMILPQVLFGWHTKECIQLAVPLATGMFVQELCYILAFLIKVNI